MAGHRTIGTKLTKMKSGDETENLKIANLTSIGEIGLTSEEIDVTDHDSEDDFKEYIAGSKDAGEVSLAGNLYRDTDFEKLLALANARTIEEWEVEYPTGSTWEFKGFVKEVKDGEKGVDGVSSFSAVIRISGKPVFTTAPVTPGP